MAQIDSHNKLCHYLLQFIDPVFVVSQKPLCSLCADFHFWTWLIIPKVKLMYFIQPREEERVYSYYISSSIFLCTFIHYILCMQNLVFELLFQLFLHEIEDNILVTPKAYFCNVLFMVRSSIIMVDWNNISELIVYTLVNYCDEI